MVSKKLTHTSKLRILKHAETTNNIRATARKIRVQPSQLRRWRKMKAQIEIAVKENPTTQTVNPGPRPENPGLEQAMLSWILHSREKINVCIQ